MVLRQLPFRRITALCPSAIGVFPRVPSRPTIGLRHVARNLQHNVPGHPRCNPNTNEKFRGIVAITSFHRHRRTVASQNEDRGGLEFDPSFDGQHNIVRPYTRRPSAFSWLAIRIVVSIVPQKFPKKVCLVSIKFP